MLGGCRVGYCGQATPEETGVGLVILKTVCDAPVPANAAPEAGFAIRLIAVPQYNSGIGPNQPNCHPKYRNVRLS